MIQDITFKSIYFTPAIGKTSQSRKELNNNYNSFVVAIIESQIENDAIVVEPPY